MDLYAGKGLTYRHYTGKPTIAFGSGMSYTTFAYRNLKLNASTVGHCDAVAVSVDVHNTGSVDSDEVVQLYTTTANASVPAPRVRLADFARVHIKAGAVATVSLSVAPKYHSVVMENVAGWEQQFWEPTIAVEAGAFAVHVGGGQPGFVEGVVTAQVAVRAGGSLSECGS